jgi:Spy/CpxP family protein refolding chaperone
MKVNQLLTTCGIAAALMLGVGTVSAQNDNGSPSGRPGGSGRGNFDPAQFQQRMMDNIKEQLGYTNDTDWNAVQPLIQKVMDARRDVGFGGGMGRMFGRNRGGNNGDNANGGVRRGGFLGGQPSPEAEALQKVIDDNSPAAQIKAALTRYEASQKAKQAKLEQAQARLRKVLTVKQEAQATLLGLLQ